MVLALARAIAIFASTLLLSINIISTALQVLSLTAFFFCRMGKPLPDTIYNEKSSSRHGLTLRRGPDPRSYHPGQTAIASAARGFFGI
jgi:hypothetical protein